MEFIHELMIFFVIIVMLVFGVTCWMLNKGLDKEFSNFREKYTAEQAISFGSVELLENDILVILCPGTLGIHSGVFLEAVKKRFPDNEVIILENGLTVGVIKMKTQEV